MFEVLEEKMLIEKSCSVPGILSPVLNHHPSVIGWWPRSLGQMSRYHASKWQPQRAR